MAKEIEHLFEELRTSQCALQGDGYMGFYVSDKNNNPITKSYEDALSALNEASVNQWIAWKQVNVLVAINAFVENDATIKVHFPKDKTELMFKKDGEKRDEMSTNAMFLFINAGVWFIHETKGA